jgi:hypothetical protein
MSRIWKLALIAVMLCVATVRGQQAARTPHIGYLYPAGGSQGSVVRISVGGQFLRGAAEVSISGEGVHGSVVRYMPQLRNINGEQRKLLLQRLQELRDKQTGELSGNGQSHVVRAPQNSAKRRAVKPNADKQSAGKTQQVKLPEHPLLDDLEHKSVRELDNIASMLFFPRNKLQPNRQLSEIVLLEVTIDPNAKPGNRELRLRTATGLTNPMIFQVGLLPEVRELEPNDRPGHPEPPEVRRLTRDPDTLDKADPIKLPVLVNGQIMPGDVDRFRFRAGKGQRLVIQVQARSLIPYLADAVPGWFQATLALYNARGKEVAYVDDYRFNPDPVLFYQVPEDGDYEMEIHDALYRGREDFVYRIAVSEQPFITRMFPLGGPSGVRTVASIAGWNLPRTRLPLNTQPGGEAIRHTALNQGKQLSNTVPYAVDTLPECNEVESNDTIKSAEQINLPKIINGRIEKPGDVDVFGFQGRAGDKIAAEVYARRLHSPLDSLLRLTDASGRVLAWNDDHVIVDHYLYENMAGLLTNHADSYLMAELPRDGEYFVQLSDAEDHGGPEYGYRLRISPPRPDFSVRVTPSSISMRGGGITPVTVYALRKDGFNGEIELGLKDASAGVGAGASAHPEQPPSVVPTGGVRIPAGCDHIRMTLAAGPQSADQTVALQLEGSARIGGRTIRHPAVAADDVMQAFLYRHLVPAKELLVFVQKSRWGLSQVELVGAAPVRIPAGGSAQVQLQAARRMSFKDIQLQLNDPPEGLSLGETTIGPKGRLTIQLKADKRHVQPGFADNLIIEAFREAVVRKKDGTPTNQKRRFSMGLLPAVPIQIVEQ